MAALRCVVLVALALPRHLPGRRRALCMGLEENRVDSSTVGWGDGRWVKVRRWFVVEVVRCGL